MNKYEILQKLNDINTQINEIYHRELLQEAGVSGAVAAVWKNAGLFKKFVMSAQAWFGKGKLVKAGFRSKTQLAAMEQLGGKVFKAGFWAPVAGFLGLGVTGAGVTGYNTYKGAAAAYKYLNPDVPASEEVLSVNEQAQTPEGESVPAASEQEISGFKKLWDNISIRYRSFMSQIQNSIGETSFFVAGFSLAILIMLAGVVLYYINTRNGQAKSAMDVFKDALNKIKNASGLEMIINIILAPVNIALGFIQQSPIPTVLFALGAGIFVIMVAALALKYTANEYAPDAAEGEEVPAEGANAYISNIW